jgi:serine/threonine protein kinase
LAGSFGKVYLVRPPQRGVAGGGGGGQDVVYAMKVLRKAEVVKRHQVEHTLTERSILAHTHHPFILALRFAFQTEHKLYMVTDYCPGGELFFHLKKLRRFTEGSCHATACIICIAYAFLRTTLEYPSESVSHSLDIYTSFSSLCFSLPSACTPSTLLLLQA